MIAERIGQQAVGGPWRAAPLSCAMHRTGRDRAGGTPSHRRAASSANDRPRHMLLVVKGGQQRGKRPSASHRAG